MARILGSEIEFSRAFELRRSREKDERILSALPRDESVFSRIVEQDRHGESRLRKSRTR
jgi:hypothetical protein